MKTTNLGDSGYVIYQASTAKVDDEDKVFLQKLFRSQEQQYRFNFPYQCGTGCDLPHAAFDNMHEVTPGKDFVVMGTDGLFDNLYDHDIEMCLKPGIKDKGNQIYELTNPDGTAECIARKAYGLSKDRRYFSPFSKGARESGRRHIGGKSDDITVIVSHIVSTDKQN